jgi:hypothetical protein
MVKAKVLIGVVSGLAVAGLLLGGCGSGAGSNTSGEGAAATAAETTEPGQQTESTVSEAQAAATGDIPDNQTFLVFHDPAAGYSIRYPEGWARKGSGNEVSFQEKANQIQIVVRNGSAHSKPGEKVTLRRQSAADPVTGKRLPLTIDRYEYEKGGKVAVLELATPVGVDNVDAYRLISESFKWQ